MTVNVVTTRNGLRGCEPCADATPGRAPPATAANAAPSSRRLAQTVVTSSSVHVGVQRAHASGLKNPQESHGGNPARPPPRYLILLRIICNCIEAKAVNMKDSR